MSYERAARAEDIQKLLWTVLATHRPKSGTYAASHNNTIAIAFHAIFLLKFYKFTQR
jgi:hypothetical protein